MIGRENVEKIVRSLMVDAGAEQAEVDRLKEGDNWRMDVQSLDSLDHVEFLMSIEEHYQVEIPDNECSEAVTFGQLLDTVCRKVC